MQFLQQYTQFVMQTFGFKMLPLHAGAVVATTGLVFSGADWAYLVFVLHAMPYGLLLFADLIGFLIPVFLPLTLWVVAYVRGTLFWRSLAAGTTYAVIVGFTLSVMLKAFTGRTSPPHVHHGETIGPLVDNSFAFNFGFMNEHVIGGWPSSHTTIAFALATTLALLLPARMYVRALLFAVALFVGLGVTFGYHWLSEFVAGACLGSAIGIVIGKHYQQ